VPITLSELASRTGTAVDGDGTLVVSRVATLESAGPGAIAFITNPKYRAQLAATRATAVIVAPELARYTLLPKLLSSAPYATYAKVATILHPPEPVTAGIHPSAVIDLLARVAPSAAVGPHAVIGAHAVIGERACVGAGSSVGKEVSIGDDAVLHANVTVYERCIVGPRTVLHSGVVIGADGFGMAEEHGRWLKIPQIGRVVIGADVEIGANTTVDRGAIEDTVIEDDVKLDNLVQVGHNCRIGAHTAIAGCVGISGSTRIGRNCKIGGAAMLNGHLDIGDGAIIMGGAGIRHSIDRPGVYAGAFPAVPHAEWARVNSNLHRLPELVRRVRELERAAGAATDTDAPAEGEK